MDNETLRRPHFATTSPIIRQNYRNKMLCRFYVALVNDALEEETYDAAIAGLGYSLARGSENLFVSVSGYNSKLPMLLKVSQRIQVSTCPGVVEG